jgi:hypothetical protein
MIPFPPWFFFRPASGPAPVIPRGVRSVVVAMPARTAGDVSVVRGGTVATLTREAVA